MERPEVVDVREITVLAVLTHLTFDSTMGESSVVGLHCETGMIHADDFQ